VGDRHAARMARRGTKQHGAKCRCRSSKVERRTDRALGRHLSLTVQYGLTFGRQPPRNLAFPAAPTLIALACDAWPP
jgi:hypothetical protein